MAKAGLVAAQAERASNPAFRPRSDTWRAGVATQYAININFFMSSRCVDSSPAI